MFFCTNDGRFPTVGASLISNDFYRTTVIKAGVSTNNLIVRGDSFSDVVALQGVMAYTRVLHKEVKSMSSTERKNYDYKKGLTLDTSPSGPLRGDKYQEKVKLHDEHQQIRARKVRELEVLMQQNAKQSQIDKKIRSIMGTDNSIRNLVTSKKEKKKGAAPKEYGDIKSVTVIGKGNIPKQVSVEALTKFVISEVKKRGPFTRDSYGKNYLQVQQAVEKINKDPKIGWRVHTSLHEKKANKFKHLYNLLSAKKKGTGTPQQRSKVDRELDELALLF